MYLKYLFIQLIPSLVLSETHVVGYEDIVLPQVRSDCKSKQWVDVLVQLTPPSYPTIPSSADWTKMDHERWFSDNVLPKILKHCDHDRKPVVDKLEQLRRQGKVNRFQPYYITNTLAVRCTPDVVEQLADMENVQEISSNNYFHVEPLASGDEAEALAGDADWDGTSPHWSLEYIRATDISPEIYQVASRLRYANADTGVEFEHPALIENYMGNKGNGITVHDYAWYDANIAPNATKPNNICGVNSQVPCGDDDHGSHTMSTAVGRLGLGVSPTTKWMACKNMDQNTGSPETYLGCLQFFLAPHKRDGTDPLPHLRPHVVGNSYSCGPSEGCSPNTFGYALEALRSAGIFMVGSAGNNGRKGCSTIVDPPAIDQNLVSVAASKYMSNERAAFSSMGPVDSRSFAIDITAPGANITGAAKGGAFKVLQGTSMAAPHVAGASLLIIAACPHLYRNVNGIREILHQTATPIYPTMGCGDDEANTRPNNEYGFGMLNVERAIQACRSQSTYRPGLIFNPSE